MTATKKNSESVRSEGTYDTLQQKLMQFYTHQLRHHGPLLPGVTPD